MRGFKTEYTIVSIGDLHFGASDPKTLLYELQKEFIEYLERMEVIDLIVIVGDLLHNKLSLNSLTARLTMEFLRRLIKVAREKSSKLRIIKGTESHDNKQLELLDIITSIDNSVDIKTISSVMEEDIFDNLKVLYIPEEYVMNKEDYYKDFFKNNYDLIFGHGLFHETSFHAINQESEITHPKAPIFDSKKFIDICRGPIFFGHIHKSQSIKNRIFYTGSFTRWCYGEEEDKGFYITTYNTETNDFKEEFIKNKLANLYNTVTIDILDVTSEIDKQFEIINRIIDDSRDTNTRIVLNIDNNEKYKSYLSLLQEKVSKSNHIKLKINNNSTLKRKKEVEEKINTLMKKYHFVFDKSLSCEDKIAEFIKVKHNKHISTDIIRKCLYEEILQ